MWCVLTEKSQLVGDKAKGRISRVFQENKARPIFRKTNISFLLIRARTCAYQGVRNVRFSENLACFVFLEHPIEIRPFALLLTNFGELGHRGFAAFWWQFRSVTDS